MLISIKTVFWQEFEGGACAAHNNVYDLNCVTAQMLTSDWVSIPVRFAFLATLCEHSSSDRPTIRAKMTGKLTTARNDKHLYHTAHLFLICRHMTPYNNSTNII